MNSDQKVIEVHLNKESIEIGDSVICQNNVGVVTDVRYNDADEVEVHWLTTQYKAARTSINTLRRAYRLSASIPSPEGGGEDDWISVEKELPETIKEIIVWRENYTDVPIQAYYFAAHKTWHGSLEVRDCMNEGYVENSRLTFEPTHWKNLPSPPKTINHE